MKKFLISSWPAMRVSDIYPGMAKDWYELGLNCPLTPFFHRGDDKAKMLAFLDECHQYGMQVILCDARSGWREALTGKGEDAYRKDFAAALADFGNHPAVLGFHVGDEPDAPDAADAFKACRIQKEMAPHLMPYLNLLPWFDWIGERMGTDAYAPYLDRCVKESGVSLLSYDCYTQMWEGDSGWDVYFDNLREHSEASVRHNIDFCSTLLSCGHYDYRCPSQDDFRWQISTAAAFGAKCLSWFIIHLNNPDGNARNAPINVFHERTDTYTWLSFENRLFQKWYGDLMMQLTVEECTFVGKAYGGCGLFQPTAEILGLDNDKGLPMLCSRFHDANGKKYWVIVNTNLDKSITSNFHLAAGVKLAEYTYQHQWQPIAAINDAVGKMAYGVDASVSSVMLAPGQMAVVTFAE